MSNFVDELNQNTRQATIASLMQTLAERPERTVGEVIDALSEDPDIDYMFEAFRSLRLLDIAEAVAPKKGVNGKPTASASTKIEADNEEAIEVEEAAPKRKSSKGKKGKSSKGKKGRKAGSDSRPASKKAPAKKSKKSPKPESGLTQSAVKRVLKGSEELMTVSEIAEALEVDSADVKPCLAAMLEGDLIYKEGKARGTRYQLTA